MESLYLECICIHCIEISLMGHYNNPVGCYITAIACVILLVPTTVSSNISLMRSAYFSYYCNHMNVVDQCYKKPPF